MSLTQPLTSPPVAAPVPTDAAAAVAAPPTPPPATPVVSQTVAVPMEQLQLLLTLPAKLAEYETRETQRAREAQEALVAEQVKRGQVEQALQMVRDQHAKDIEAERTAKLTEQARARSYAKSAELGRALAGVPFVSQAAAEQFAGIIAGQFDAHPEGDGFTVRTATFEAPSQVIARLRTDPNYAHFFSPTHTGGTGATGGQFAAPTPPAGTGAPADPKNLGEAILMRWQENHAANGGTPIGLGRRKRGG